MKGLVGEVLAVAQASFQTGTGREFLRSLM
jgi:hypothetical protein